MKKRPLTTEFRDLDISVALLHRLYKAGFRRVEDVRDFRLEDWLKLKLTVKQQLLLLLELEEFGIRLIR